MLLFIRCKHLSQVFLPVVLRTIQLSSNRTRTLATSCKNLAKMSSLDKLKLLSQQEAINLDRDLFETCCFSVDQLMELAGLSCAQAIALIYPVEKLSYKGNVLVLCGPGNNGGDGLVCARHLASFGYSPTVFYPKPSSSDLMKRLVMQLKSMDIPSIICLPKLEPIDNSFDLVIDALFGFSFRPPIREPFVGIVEKLQKITLPIVSIDIPSGWDVDSGPPKEGLFFNPNCLISLTAPKLCSQYFTGRYHYLGGRFVPPIIADKYELSLPKFPGCQNVVSLK